MMGLHPTYVKDNYLEELQHVEEELDKENFTLVKLVSICIGTKPFASATNSFRKQIQLANNINYQSSFIVEKLLMKYLKFGRRKVRLIYLYFIVFRNL
jgi:predicted metal-dependent TIM-barrel fold hydrolase